MSFLYNVAYFHFYVSVDDIELVESAHTPVKHPVPDKAGFDEVLIKKYIIFAKLCWSEWSERFRIFHSGFCYQSCTPA